jgi:Ni/Fe-hydrogenase subunit HybB-like protein
MNKTTRTWTKDVLWVIVLAGLIASIIRFTSGLGIATGMNDSAPWGLWIAFKLVFVALAGGGFSLAAMVYIFHLERYRPILRRAILLALLGYGSFIVSLIFDLGMPWHIYMPVINWQHHSVMFEIAWCVMLYFSVLVLEISPAILEHPWFSRPVFKALLHWLHRLTLPLIIAGIVLSTLHQSSLGSLFLIMPHRIHPLWYSPWIPYMFFTSAIAAGLLALILEALMVERWFQVEPDFDLLDSLGRIAIFPLGLYLMLRLSDQWMRGVLPGGLDGSWQSVLYLSEIVLGGILPIVLLSIKRIRRTIQGLLSAAILGILGIISQRMSLSMITMFRPQGTSYIPSLGEILIAFAIPAAAVLLYLFFAENLQLYGTQHQDVTWASLENAFLFSQVQRGRFIFQGGGLRSIVARRSGMAVFVFALAFPVLMLNRGIPASPVAEAKGWELLQINGNNSGYQVRFPHSDHQLRFTNEITGQSDCQVCHHLDKPQDEMTACSGCHSDYHQTASIFDHNSHEDALGGNASCQECHTQEHIKQTAEICQNCHQSMAAVNGEVTFSMLAVSYHDALHGRCLACHEDQAMKQANPELALCSTCHTHYQDPEDQRAARLSGE